MEKVTTIATNTPIVTLLCHLLLYIWYEYLMKKHLSIASNILPLVIAPFCCYMGHRHWSQGKQQPHYLWEKLTVKVLNASPVMIMQRLCIKPHSSSLYIQGTWKWKHNCPVPPVCNGGRSKELHAVHLYLQAIQGWKMPPGRGMLSWVTNESKI